MQPNNEAPDRPQKAKDKASELELRVGMKSDVGPKRKLNEDYAGYRLPDEEGQRSTKGALFVVADGMGGHQAGEVASKEAVVRVIEEYYADADHPPGDSLVRAIHITNRVIHEHALSDPAKSGMGTTLVAAAVLGQKVFVANVGDSRAYLIAGQGVSQITEDHSWVEEQIRAGLLSRDEAARHPQRNLITRALGSKASVQVDLFEGKLGEGETLLLCTDGLCGPLRGKQMARAVRSADPQDAAVQLVAQAGSLGGDDNATVLIVHAAPPARPAQPEDREQTVISPTPGLATSALVSAREWLGGLPSIVPRESYRPLVLALAALTLLLCLAAFVAFLWGRDPLPRAAPMPAAVYDGSLSGLDQEQIARYLGYASFAEMQQAHGGILDPAAQPLWPAEWGLYLAGRAHEWQCTEQRCSFTLKVADDEYQVGYPNAGQQSMRGSRRVLVFGQGQKGSHAIDARLIVRSNRWWALWQPRREVIYQDNLGESVWVYSTVDKSPNGLVEPGDDSQHANGWQERGSPILLIGYWQEDDPLPTFRYERVYSLEGNRYVPMAGTPDIISLPTSTAAPTPTKSQGSQPDPTKKPGRRLLPLPTIERNPENDGS